MSTIHSGIESGYEFDGQTWVPRGQPDAFGYSDGDEAEQRIAAAIAGCEDVSLFSRSLREHQVDWPSRYHLSASRANLLRPIERLLKGRVLEVGSGCGAISRYLGETGASLVALEGSRRRARMTASRCRDLPNVQVVNDVLDSFSAERGFDAVTLIGVLEYARVYGTTEEPAAAWLRKAHALLADDGCLVVAIENQLGLKYLAGMPEDHVGKAMHGISDNYDSDTVATFGRVELEAMLRQAGFEQCEFLLPFPDYKFPGVVVMPAAVDGSHRGFDAGTLASQSASSDPQLPYPPLFSLERAWSVVGRNGLLPDLANSFLVVARKEAAPRVDHQDGQVVLAHHYATERVPVFCKQVVFKAAGDADNVEVTRRRLAEDDQHERSRPISMQLPAEGYVRGRLHSQALEQILTRDGWRPEKIAEWLQQWISVLRREVAATGHSGDTTRLPGWTLDALPRNLMCGTDGELGFIDLEWVWHGELDLRYLLFRAIVGSVSSLVAVAPPQDITHINLPTLFGELMTLLGEPVSEGDLERFIDTDAAVTRLVYGHDSGLTLRAFKEFKLRVLPDAGRVARDWQGLMSELADRAELIRLREQEIARGVELVRQREQEIAQGVELVRLRDAEVASLRRHCDEAKHAAELQEERVRAGERERQVLLAARDALACELQARTAELHLASAQADELDRVLASVSWRITRPLRGWKQALRPRSLKQTTGRVLRGIYRALPVSESVRQSIKSGVFRLFPTVFGSTQAYRAWHAARLRPAVAMALPDVVVEQPMSDGVVYQRYAQDVLQLPRAVGSPEYVAIATAPDPRASAARLIAFYLPQFHPFEENEAWWGRGFTEWTNVSKAVPQFIGHYQPHLPGELGFYDLRLVDVMRRQAELAKLYGVEGFCFHYYWFAGKRLMERPLDQFLASDIDLPFCLCWANENWTRRWDGLDSEVLIAQDYGPEDDLAFIRALEPVLRDPRYIRVDGRPLLILYRPSLLPDAAATLERWRTHCREVGIGELFLCMVQFDKLDPREYGFDAAVEFPPHKIAAGLPSINHELEIVNPDYQGTVVDYADIIGSALSEQKPDYDLIRGVFPGWDNDARKPGKGYSVARSTPARYRTWLRGAIDYARTNQVRGESLVFVNAWNEWAEGAHLEPDRRHGYAYLEATRQALRSPPTPRLPERVIVVIHAFYPELLPEMFEELSAWDVPYQLVISTVEEKVSDVRGHLEQASLDADVHVSENRGRDILPFLDVMNRLDTAGAVILKLHTKRSLHRQDGESWRRDMVGKLLAPDAARTIYEAYRMQPQLGLVAPEGHILSMATYWGANADSVQRLSREMHSDPVDPAIAMFAAGSMFYVRPEAIEAIMALGLTREDFEEEGGQVDGTLAHAIERCFSIATCSSGYYIASNNNPLMEAYGMSGIYDYAAPTR